MADAERSRAARAASERALVRVVHHYGARPEFVVLGGLVPELLCAGSGWRHAGTTDVDVQVDLEVACGAVNAARLENALRNAEFEPDTERAWRWVAEDTSVKTVVKFELLTDLDTEPNEATVRFDACDNLGAVNLRGTGFASRDDLNLGGDWFHGGCGRVLGAIGGLRCWGLDGHRGFLRFNADLALRGG